MGSHCSLDLGCSADKIVVVRVAAVDGVAVAVVVGLVAVDDGEGGIDGGSLVESEGCPMNDVVPSCHWNACRYRGNPSDGTGCS